MAAVTICSDFGVPQNKVWHCFQPPSISHEVMGPDAMILVFWMVSFKPTFSLSSFTFIKKHHLCPWVNDFSCIICFHAVLLATTQSNELLTMPCVCLWSFLHVSLKRTVWSFWGIFLCDTKARSIFLGVHYPATSGTRKKSLWYVFYRYFLFGWFFLQREKPLKKKTISDKVYC